MRVLTILKFPYNARYRGLAATSPPRVHDLERQRKQMINTFITSTKINWARLEVHERGDISSIKNQHTISHPHALLAQIVNMTAKSRRAQKAPRGPMRRAVWCGRRGDGQMRRCVLKGGRRRDALVAVRVLALVQVDLHLVVVERESAQRHAVGKVALHVLIRTHHAPTWLIVEGEGTNR